MQVGLSLMTSNTVVGVPVLGDLGQRKFKEWREEKVQFGRRLAKLDEDRLVKKVVADKIRMDGG